MTLLAQMVACAIAFVSGVYWMKWNDSVWVLLPMFGGPFVSILIGALGAVFDPENR